MFFIESGECSVSVSIDSRMTSKHVRTLYPGDYFGEIVYIIDEANRSASVMSTGYTTLSMINEKEVINLFKKFPFIKQELFKRSIKYDDDQKLFLEGVLKKIDYLKDAPSESLNKIVFSLTFAKFDSGSKIF